MGVARGLGLCLGGRDIGTRLGDFLRSAAGLESCQGLCLRRHHGARFVPGGLQACAMQAGYNLIPFDPVAFLYQNRVDVITLGEGQLHLADIHIAIQRDSVACRLFGPAEPPAISAEAGHDDDQHQGDEFFIHSGGGICVIQDGYSDG